MHTDDQSSGRPVQSQNLPRIAKHECAAGLQMKKVESIEKPRSPAQRNVRHLNKRKTNHPLSKHSVRNLILKLKMQRCNDTCIHLFYQYSCSSSIQSDVTFPHVQNDCVILRRFRFQQDLHGSGAQGSRFTRVSGEGFKEAGPRPPDCGTLQSRVGRAAIVPWCSLQQSLPVTGL